MKQKRKNGEIKLINIFKNNQFVKLLFILLLILNLLACNHKAENGNNINNKFSLNMTKIDSILALQLKDGLGSNYGGKEGLEVLFEAADTIFKNTGYIKPTHEEMEKRIKYVFGNFYPNKSSDISYITFYKEPLKYETGEIMDIINIDVLTYNNNVLSPLYFSYTHRIITYAYYLPEILNYEKLFPKLLDLEKTTLWGENEDGEKIKYLRWKDITNLKQQQLNNKEFLVHLNKYILNDNRASLAWLINNHTDFLEMLVDNYHYMKDKKLLNWIINKRFILLSSREDDLKRKVIDLGRLIVYRNSLGEVIFNQDLFVALGETPDDKYVSEICYFLTLSYTQYSDVAFLYHGDDSISFEERAMVYAYILYWGETIVSRNKNVVITGQSYTYSVFNNQFMVNFCTTINDYKKYEKEFEKRNYYNLPHFKEYWQQALNIKHNEYNVGPQKSPFIPEDEG